MFCRNCGGKLEEGWTCCPNCGEELHIVKAFTLNENNGRLNTEKTEVSKAPVNITPDTSVEGSMLLSGNILRILAIIALVCFFCPLFMVSCAGEELLTISGTDLTFGFECMEEEMEGNLIYGTLALFPLLSFGSLLESWKKGNIKEKCEQIKKDFCSSAAAAGATIVMIRYFKIH